MHLYSTRRFNSILRDSIEFDEIRRSAPDIARRSKVVLWSEHFDIKNLCFAPGYHYGSFRSWWPDFDSTEVALATLVAPYCTLWAQFSVVRRVCVLYCVWLCCVLYIVCCVLWIVCCVLCVVHFVLCCVYCVLCIMYCVLCIVYCGACIVYCIVYCVLCSRY